MGKNILIIVLLIIICCLGIELYYSHDVNEKSVTENNVGSEVKESVELGNYTLNEVNFEEMGYYYTGCGITIKENNEFYFNLGDDFGYSGKYEEKDDDVICKATVYSEGSIGDRETDIVFTFKKVSKSTLELTKLERNDSEASPELSVFEIGTTYSKSNSNIQYSIDKVDKDTVKITASEVGKTQEVEIGAEILDTGFTMLPKVGIVATILSSNDEFYGVSIYQLVGEKIERIGLIDLSKDVKEESQYKVKKENENTAIIECTVDGKTIEKEIKTKSNITNIQIINILDLYNSLDHGKVVAIGEADEDEYILKLYRLSGDNSTEGEMDIIEVGTIEH